MLNASSNSKKHATRASRSRKLIKKLLPEPKTAQREEAPADKKRWPGVVRAVLLTAAMFVVGQIFGGVVISVMIAVTKTVTAKESISLGGSVSLQFVYAVLVYGAMTTVLVWLLRRRRLNVADLGLTKKPHLYDAVWAIIAFLSYMSVYIIALAILKPLVPGLNTEQKQDIGFDGASGVSLVLVYCTLAVIAPIAEELLMRGFLFTTVRRRLGFWMTALITSVVFASLHLGGGEAGAGLLWIAAVDTFVLSFVLCYLREKTGRLWAGIGLHMIKNTVAFLALFIFSTSS